MGERVMRVEFLDASIASSRNRWVQWWEEWPAREVFAHPAYVSLFARPGDRVLCAGWKSSSSAVLFPFILRPLSSEAWADAQEPSWDLISPYGYGGAYCWNCQPEEQSLFWDQVDKWQRQHAVVSSFLRLSLFPESLLAFPGTVERKASNIVRGLNLSADALWQDYDHKVRKNVKRARGHGLRVEFDFTAARLEEFLNVYYSTMSRRDAAEAYYFARDFFERIVVELKGQFVLVHVLHKEQVISSELVLLSTQYAYSFLGGTTQDAFSLRPNDFLKHEVVLWARQAGKRAFVLGGGYAPEDGIYRYKKAFAPSGDVAFHVAKAVHDEAEYARLVGQRTQWELSQGREWSPRPDFFPAYRA